ncbi:Fic family protein [Natronorubrum daqingense]|uniref:Cell filamentation protein Fic n=1 Tax=Natronorubrum daqingense TaxID=588898 RepID=A0A1N7FPN9_9EURY|nr:Fic family protein [Natronorubrum daqingense]APX97313.1 cell filamentation protein Fic [Natronorubrum daqingense]SIS02322.1 Fic family protein [Natronorubrum daqingense]
MDSADFTDGPGRIDEYDDLPCHTPASLPPDLEYTDDLLAVYGDANYALGRLATLERDLENPNLLIAPFVHREAAMSSQVEGTNVTISDIYAHELGSTPERSAAERDDVREAYNYVDAVTYGFEHLDDGGDIDQEFTCDLHDILLGGVRGEEQRPGELRDIPVYIGSPDGGPKNASFIPANPDLVELLLDQLFSYAQRGEYPPLIDTALIHYQFEAIHPFRDGNGRLGRLLIMLQLYDAGLLPGPYLYLSAYFKRFGGDYREKLLAVSTEGAYEEWTTFVLDAIAEQAIDAYDCGVELTDLRRAYRERFPSHPTARELVDYVFEQPYLTGPRAIEAIGRSKPSVYEAISALEREGIVRETTGKQRGKVYEAPDVLDVLDSN